MQVKLTQPSLPPTAFSYHDRASHAGPTGVTIQILCCGVCHSDLHTARGESAGVKFPAVPGHEIVGRATAIGNSVTKVKADDIV